jgi:hypothetical protein
MNDNNQFENIPTKDSPLNNLIKHSATIAKIKYGFLIIIVIADIFLTTPMILSEPSGIAKCVFGACGFGILALCVYVYYKIEN